MEGDGAGLVTNIFVGVWILKIAVVNKIHAIILQ